MHYRKNIFKDKTFVAMSLVSLITAGLIVGCGCTSKSGENTNDTSESKTESESKDDNNDNARRSINQFSDDAESGASDIFDNIESGASDIRDDIESGASDIRDDIESGASDIRDGINSGASDSRNKSDEHMTISMSDPSDEPSDNLSAAHASVPSLTFSSNETLIWPVDTTDIILEYSPNSTIYFATLDKYKTNDAICVRSEIGTPVYASADGIVADIGYNEEIGNSISLNLGNDYLLTYGQIKDLQVNEGDEVKEGDILCYVANPTKYFTVEGPNLYLKLTVDGSSVDPLDYLDY